MLNIILGGGLLLMSTMNYAISIAGNNKTNGTSVLHSSAANQSVTHDANMGSDANSLRQGQVDEINFNKRTLRIKDQVFEFDAKNIRVFSAGQSSTIKLVVKGSKIGFLLDPLDKTAKKIAVIYLN